MKVALLYWSKEGISGTERYAHALIRHMKRLSSEYNIKLQVIPIRKLERSFLGRPIGGIISLLAQISRIKPKADIVHSLSPEVICPTTNLVTVHDVFPIKYPHMYSPNYLMKKFNEKTFGKISKIPYIISVSKATLNDLRSLLGIDPKKVRVIYEGVDFSTFFPEPSSVEGLEKDKKSLLLVGDLNPRKKYEIVFEGVSKLDEWVVYHIGTRNAWNYRWKILEKLARKFPTKIKLLGPLNDTELRKWLSSVDFFVFPSIDEGFGLPALEAMACGTNVILSDIPVFREIIGDMAASYFHLSSEDFIKALVKASPKNSKELISFARKFSWENVAKQTLEYYLEIT